jgi:hypothetical protein
VSITVGQRSVHDFWNPQAGNRIEWSGSAGSEGVLDLGRGAVAVAVAVAR